MEEEDSLKKNRVDSPVNTPEGNTSNHHEAAVEKHPVEQQPKVSTVTELSEEKATDTDIDNQKIDTPTGEPHEELQEVNSMEKRLTMTTAIEVPEEKEPDTCIENQKVPIEDHILSSPVEENEAHTSDFKQNSGYENSSDVKKANSPPPEKLETESNLSETSLRTSDKKFEVVGEKGTDALYKKEGEFSEVDAGNSEGTDNNLQLIVNEEETEPVFDGTEIPGLEANRNLSAQSLGNESEIHGYAWPEKAAAIKNFVREKSAVAVSSVLRRLSGKSDDGLEISNEEDTMNRSDADTKEVPNSTQEAEAQEDVSRKTGERSGWNPLSFIGISRDSDPENKSEQMEDINKLAEPIPMKGRIILYTRLGCQDCKEARLFLHQKRLRYVEINIDVYPGRKFELEKIAGSSAVPRVFFNEVLIGGLSELKGLDENGELLEKIEYIISEGPSFEAPLPPLSGEDDVCSSGSVDELAVIVRKMKDSVVVKDRFCKMRRFTNSFLGSEAVDFLSEDQYLEREEAIEFGRKLASKLFFQHVLEENLFEDGNHVYRFLDDDPFISQCQNIPRGIIELKPKPIVDISSRLRLLCYAIFEAYTSEDGKHVDYRSIHGSEEFARYLRLVEELQRVDLHDVPREEKLAFFINLYNMMAIHAILVWGHASGALERRKLFGEFKYVVGGCTYSLSAIHNGILRGNQRPPYNLTKPFGVRDKRSKVALPYPEPLVHFALVCGTRSGPALRCYSPGNIDKELMEAARNFLRSGGLVVDLTAKIASVNKMLKWFSVDFGKNEIEVLKHAANYLEPVESQELLELLDTTQLKVVYQPYDWGLNH